LGRPGTPGKLGLREARAHTGIADNPCDRRHEGDYIDFGIRRRRARSGLSDSALVDEALGALLSRERAVEIDAAYAAYERYPLDAPDEWGDLDSFRKAAGAL
jgi:hypothetical protein